MGWLEKITASELTVTTGDNVEYTLLFKNPSKDVNMNSVPMEFNDTPGAFIPRGEVSYRRFPIEFYFQGDDHLEKAAAFEESARNVLPWTVSHPYYDDILCQPSPLSYDNSNDNVTKITGTLYETIDFTPDISIDFKLKAASGLLQSNLSSINDSASMSPGTVSQNTIGNTSESTFNTLKSGAVTNHDLSVITNAIAKADAAINTLASEPIQYMRQFADVLRAPAKFYATVTTRINLFKDAYEDVKNAAAGLPPLSEKIFFEAAASMTIQGMGEASLITTNEIAQAQGIDSTIKELSTRNEVLAIIDILNSYLDDYIAKIGELQSLIDNKLDSYYPSHDTVFYLKEAIASITGSLLQIAANSRQERVYTLKEDMPILVLVSFLLNTTDDEVVKEFIANNKLVQDEFLLIKEGKNVIYYI